MPTRKTHTAKLCYGNACFGVFVSTYCLPSPPDICCVCWEYFSLSSNPSFWFTYLGLTFMLFVYLPITFSTSLHLHLPWSPLPNIFLFISSLTPSASFCLHPFASLFLSHHFNSTCVYIAPLRSFNC